MSLMKFDLIVFQSHEMYMTIIYTLHVPGLNNIIGVIGVLRKTVIDKYTRSFHVNKEVWPRHS